MTFTAKQTCVLCDSQLADYFTAPEGMFGLGGSFAFATCPTCGIVSQIDPPADLSPYYPSNYYSFASSPASPPKQSALHVWLANRRNDAQIFGRPWWALPLARRIPSTFVSDLARHLKHVSLDRGKDVRILDVGCGNGGLLHRFASVGFRKLEGVDPYIASAELNSDSVRIRRTDHMSLQNEQYDLIMLNHSLEHMQDQKAAVVALPGLLSDTGVVRIEVPVADSDAFAEYRDTWAELDPPRHLYLHTRKSLTLFADRVNLHVIEIEEAGWDFEFWGSEMLRRGITLFDNEKSRLRSAAEVFSEAERADFRERTAEAKLRKRSGRVAIHLRKKR